MNLNLQPIIAVPDITLTPISSASTVIELGAPGEAFTLEMEAALQGPPGPSAAFHIAQFSGLAAGQTIALAAAPGSLQILVMNGLIQLPSDYSVSGSNLILPIGLAYDGVPCLFIYNI